ncbi:MAG: YceI family protein [Bdellovibrionales bacterium]|nr:YceI family protein [Bdellovibrionales bacterium]
MLKQLIFAFTILFSLSSLANIVVDPTKSVINWKGKKVTGEHVGTVKVKSGNFDLKKQKATVVVDMTSIDVTDLKGEWKGKLMNHLRSDDFFSVDKHKEAKLVLDKMINAGKDKYNVSGKLTIKGKTQPVKFEVVEKSGTYEGELTFDRTKFDVKYKSGKFFENLGDKLIYDDVKLNFKIAAKK